MRRNDRHTLRKVERKLAGAIIWIMLVLILIIARINIASGAENDAIISVEERHDMEKNTIDSIKSILAGAYMSNCGVTINKVIYSECCYGYSIQIHHEMLKNLGYEERNELVTQIEGYIYDIYGMDNVSEYEYNIESIDEILISYVN